MRDPIRALPLLIAAAIATGCASTSPDRQEIRDSLEPVNRPVFEINRQVDHHAFGPIARGYKKVTPSVFRRSVSNVQRNLNFPERLVSTMGQAEFEKAGVETGRFLLNTTVGLGGIFDPATRVGLAKYDEDLGKMLARWHVPPGPYIVIPVLGPSTARDGLGDLASIALNPMIWAGDTMPPLGVLFAINRRAEADDRIRAAEEAALDFYVFARDAYIQRRTRFIRNEYVTRVEDTEVADDVYVLAPDLYDLPSDDTPPTGCGAPHEAGDAPAADPPPSC